MKFEAIAQAFKVFLCKRLNLQYSTLSYSGSITLSILVPIAEFNYCCIYGNTYQTRRATHEFHQFHIKWSKCRDVGLWRELCTTASKFHFFPSLVQMNFSMHEKKCKEIGEMQKIGENKLFCLLQWSQQSLPCCKRRSHWGRKGCWSFQKQQGWTVCPLLQCLWQ